MGFKNKLKILYRRKKTFNISFSLILLLLVFILYIFGFAINDLVSNYQEPIISSNFQHAYNLYDDNLEKKVQDYREVYVQEYPFINKEDFEKYEHPEPVSLKIRVNKVYNLDEITQTFIASGTIEALWDDSAIQRFDLNDNEDKIHQLAKKDVLADAELSFFNAEDQMYERINLVNKTNPSPDEYQNFSKYKFQGRFRFERDMRKFPFDSAYLTIRVTHKLLAPDIWLWADKDSILRDPQYRLNAYKYKAEKCYEESKNENGEISFNPISYSCVYDEIEPLQTVGEEFQTDSEVSDQFMELWSKLDYGPSILIRSKLIRSFSSSFFRYLLPLLFGVSILTFNEFISTQFREIRIATPPTILLTFIFMQNGFHSEIPQISYLTFLDRIYFLCYSLALISMINGVLAGTKRNKIRRYFYRVFNISLIMFLRKTFFLLAIFGPFILFIIP